MRWECMLQTLANLLVAVVGSVERAAGTVDAHRNEIVLGVVNPLLLQRLMSETEQHAILITATALLDPPVINS